MSILLVNAASMLPTICLQSFNQEKCMFGNKTLGLLKKILGQHHGGIYKRIDENRELLELLQREAPELLAKQPWVVSWLESQDGFLRDLESAVPLTDVQFPKQANTSGRSFPRPWPTVQNENAAVVQWNVSTPGYWGLPNDIVFRVSRGDQTSPIPCTFDQMLDFLDASGLNLARDEVQVAGIIAGIPFEMDGAAMQFEQVRSNGAKPDWAMHAHPLKQITIRLQGTRHSEPEIMLQHMEEVVGRIKGGEVRGESSDDDFGYEFSVELRSNKPSIFSNAPATSA